MLKVNSAYRNGNQEIALGAVAKLIAARLNARAQALALKFKAFLDLFAGNRQAAQPFKKGCAL